MVAVKRMEEEARGGGSGGCWLDGSLRWKVVGEKEVDGGWMISSIVYPSNQWYPTAVPSTLGSARVI